MSNETALSDLRSVAQSKGISLSMLNIEVSWDDGKPEVLVQADLDRGEGEDYETILFESKGRTIDGSLAKIRSMIEGMSSAK